MRVYVGGYTHDQAAPAGLAQAHLVGPGTLELALLDAGPDPSWAALDRAGRRLYAVAETEQGGVRALDTRTGQETGRASSGGSAPCHLALADDGRTLAVANYVGGSVGLLTVDGGQIELLDVLQLEGSGPHERQEASHAHQVTWVGPGELVVCDLGVDRLWGLAAADQRLRHTWEVALPAGTGPRHLARSPGAHAWWVIGELDGRVHPVLRSPEGVGWELQEPVPLLEPGETMTGSTGGGLVADGSARHLYATVRGADLLVHLVVGPDGLPRPAERLATGACPRFVGWLADGRLAVAAQHDDRVDLHDVDTDGVLAPAQQHLAWTAPAWVGSLRDE